MRHSVKAEKFFSSEEREQIKKTVQDVETRTPAILTTSQLLTTGLDAPTCRNVVLVRYENDGVPALVKHVEQVHDLVAGL